MSVVVNAGAIAIPAALARSHSQLIEKFMSQENFKQVPLPDYVQVSVADLHRLQEDSARLAALEKAGVEQTWQEGCRFALWLFEHDPDIQDIKLGWKKRKDSSNSSNL